MLAPPIPSSGEDQRLEAGYEELGRREFASVMNAVRRCLDFARIKKGQYWLVVPDFGDPYSLSLAGRARVTFEGGSSREWLPPSFIRDPIGLKVESEDRFIAADDWGRLCGFVNGNGRVDLVKELRLEPGVWVPLRPVQKVDDLLEQAQSQAAKRSGRCFSGFQKYLYQRPAAA